MIYRSERDTSAVGRQSVDIEYVFGSAKPNPVTKATAVPVTVKRRRAIEGSDVGTDRRPDDLGRSEPSDRQSRVFTVAQSGPLAPATSPTVLEAASEAAQATSPARPRRRRHRMDEARAPGAVTRIVFDIAPSPGPVDQSSSILIESPLDASVQPGFEDVLQALERVRATLRLAAQARMFRFT